MRRPACALAVLAIPAILWGCGSDAKEEAPAVATGDVLAQAPPNAVGADVQRPVATVATAAGPAKPVPGMKLKPKLTAEPDEPDEPVVPPNAGEPPKKGTDL